MLGKMIIVPMVLVVLTLLMGCTKRTTTEHKKIDIFSDVYTDKSRYNPGEKVQINVSLHNRTEDLQNGKVDVRLKFVNQTIKILEKQSVSVQAGERKNLTFEFDAPAADFKGYLIETNFMKENSSVDVYTSAVDVSSDWSKFPRYGYLVSYGNKPQSIIDNIITDLSKYHINGLQFYDWQYEHHVPLPLDENGNPLERWVELSNRDVYYSTVKGYIDAAHEHNMMAMNYNLLFGTYENPQDEGVNLEWGLYKDRNGEHVDYHPLPNEWQSSKLLLMDPGNADWQEYIFEQEQIAISNLNFDGWHVDQLGYRGERFDYQGNPVNLEADYIDFLNNAQDILDTRLVFNAVDGYAQDRIAMQTSVDFLYQEVWTPKDYSDLKRIIDNGFNKSNNQKSTILAAYMNYGKRNTPGSFNEHSVLLTNATIFASGGAHLELGDTGMLSSEYFPSNNLKMTTALKQRLRNYYDFLVAYQNLLRDNVVNSMVRIDIEGITTSSLGMRDSIWYFGKAKDNYQMIHLINVLGNEVDWRDDEKDKKAPPILESFEMKIYIDDDIKNVFVTSPDNNDILPINLEFTKEIDSNGKSYILVTIPRLEYWDMIILEK